MRIMYFGFEGFDTPNGNNHLIIKMIDYLLHNGIEVYYLSSHTTGENNDIPEILQNREGFAFDIVNRKPVNKKNFINRYLNGFHYAIKSIKYWRKERKSINLVILQSRPTVVFSAVFLKTFLRKPIIFNYYDIFPNGPYSYGAINNKIIYKILRLLQNIVYHCSDKILTISEDTKRTLIHDEGVPADKVEIIYNWFNEEQIKIVPITENRFVKEYEIDTKKFIIQYAGNFGFTFNYKAVLDIAEILKNYKDIEFHMIGTGTFEIDFKKEAKERNLTNIKFFPWQKLDVISDVYSYCDLELIPLSKGVIKTSYPSKCSLLMACKKPFICVIEKDSNFYKMVNEEKIGICTPIDDLKTTANKIISLYHDKNELEQISKNAYEYGFKHFSSIPNLIKLLSIINKLGEDKNEYF